MLVTYSRVPVNWQQNAAELDGCLLSKQVFFIQISAVCIQHAGSKITIWTSLYIVYLIRICIVEYEQRSFCLNEGVHLLLMLSIHEDAGLFVWISNGCYGIYKWTVDRPSVTIKLWPTNSTATGLGCRTTTSTAISPEQSGLAHNCALPIFCFCFQLRSSQRKPNMLSKPFT